MSSMLFGKVLLGLGIILAIFGAWVLANGRLPSLPSWMGRLPGDLSIEREHVRIYLPIATSLVVSAVLTLLLWFFSRRG